MIDFGRNQSYHFLTIFPIFHSIYHLGINHGLSCGLGGNRPWPAKTTRRITIFIHLKYPNGFSGKNHGIIFGYNIGKPQIDLDLP